MLIVEILKEGHKSALDKLSQLELIAEELKEGKAGPDTLQKLEELSSFFNNEVEAHFKQEERVLFPVMEKFIGRAGFIQAMLEEHQSFWKAIDALNEKIELCTQLRMEGKAETQEVRSISQIASHIAAYLRSHINKEEKSFFPLVETSLDPLSQKETELLIEQLKSVHPNP